MAKYKKPQPKSASEVIQSQIEPYLPQGKPTSETVSSENRGTDYSMKGDTVKDVSVGLEDMDNAVLYYFENILKPTVIQDGKRVSVRVIFGTPERWKSVQADGFFRDSNNQIIVPIIMIKRDSVEKNRTLGNKLDGNKVHNYQIIGTKYNKRNAYDKFNILNNRIPSEQYYISAVPDYVTLKYSCVIFTNFIEQNNNIVEAINFASDSYWGDMNRFKFRASIDSYATTVAMENNADRAAKTTFNITLNGYIIPDTLNKSLATARSKFYTKSQIIFNTEVIDSGGVTTSIDEMKFANKAPAANTLAATSFIGGGVTQNITNIIDSDDLIYINTNKQLSTNPINSTTFIYVGESLLQPPAGSTLPATSSTSFIHYVNGQHIPTSLVDIDSLVGGVTFKINNTGLLEYVLTTSDEIVTIGKFA